MGLSFPPTKLTPEIIDRAAALKAQGLSMNQVRDEILDEFGLNIPRTTLLEALQRHEDRKRRAEAVKRIEAQEGEMAAEAARRVAATIAAEDLPEDAKLLQLRLATLISRANGAWEGMSDKEKTSPKQWAKLEDLTIKYLFLKFRLGGALQPGDADLENADRALLSKIDGLARKPKAT